MERANSNELPVLSVDQYLKEKENKDICLESCWGDQLFEKPADYCREITYTEDDDISYLYNNAKKVKVFTKKPFKISSDWLKQRCSEYAKQWGMNQWNVEPECLNMFNEFTRKFNKKQYWYAADKQIAWVDLSDIVKKEFCRRENIKSEAKWQETISV